MLEIEMHTEIVQPFGCTINAVGSVPFRSEERQTHIKHDGSAWNFDPFKPASLEALDRQQQYALAIHRMLEEPI